MMYDINDPELIHATLQNIYTTLSVYKQKEREYRLFAKADRGCYYTADKDRYTREAEKYKKLIEELDTMTFDIVADIKRHKTI